MSKSAKWVPSYLPLFRPICTTSKPHNTRILKVQIITYKMIPHLSFRKKVVLNLKIFLVGDPPISSKLKSGFNKLVLLNVRYSMLKMEIFVSIGPVFDNYGSKLSYSGQHFGPSVGCCCFHSALISNKDTVSDCVHQFHLLVAWLQ